jgi:Flp pilus assembly protein TadD
MLNNPIDSSVRETTFGDLDAALDQTRKALRLANFTEAEQLLERVRRQRDRESADYFNLLGALHEGRGKHRLARKCYGKANAFLKTFEPAQSNLQRLHQIGRDGTTERTLRLGDENDAVWYAKLPRK